MIKLDKIHVVSSRMLWRGCNAVVPQQKQQLEQFFEGHAIDAKLGALCAASATGMAGEAIEFTLLKVVNRRDRNREDMIGCLYYRRDIGKPADWAKQAKATLSRAQLKTLQGRIDKMHRGDKGMGNLGHYLCRVEVPLKTRASVDLGAKMLFATARKELKAIEAAIIDEIKAMKAANRKRASGRKAA